MKSEIINLALTTSTCERAQARITPILYSLIGDTSIGKLEVRTHHVIVQSVYSTEQQARLPRVRMHIIVLH